MRVGLSHLSIIDAGICADTPSSAAPPPRRPGLASGPFSRASRRADTNSLPPPASPAGQPRGAERPSKMCICFFDDGPIDKDPRANRGNMFKVGMKDAPCKDPAICFAGFFCNPRVGCYMRKKVLGGNLDLYMCCQGYYDGLCCGHPKAGSYGDTGNPACMACADDAAPGWATSATRQYVMDQYDLASDPCDRQIIRFRSCSCSAHLGQVLAIIEPSCRENRQCVGCIADLHHSRRWRPACSPRSSRRRAEDAAIQHERAATSPTSWAHRGGGHGHDVHPGTSSWRSARRPAAARRCGGDRMTAPTWKSTSGHPPGQH